MTRWVDGCLDAKMKYGINKRILRNVLDNTLAPMLMKAVETWPRYAYHEENAHKWRDRTESDVSSCGTIQKLTSRGNTYQHGPAAPHFFTVLWWQCCKRRNLSAALWLAWWLGIVAWCSLGFRTRAIYLGSAQRCTRDAPGAQPK